MLAQVEAATEIDWPSVGVIGFLFVMIAVAGLKRWWLFTWTHERIVAGKEAEIELLKESRDLARKESDEWKTLALTQAGVLETTVKQTTQIVRQVARDRGENP